MGLLGQNNNIFIRSDKTRDIFTNQKTEMKMLKRLKLGTSENRVNNIACNFSIMFVNESYLVFNHF